MRKITSKTYTAANAAVNGKTFKGPRALFDFASLNPTWAKDAEKVPVLFDIVPYEVSSKKHPLVMTKQATIGDVLPFLNVKVHTLGPDGTSVLCLAQFGKPCPACTREREEYNAHVAKNLPRDSEANKASYALVGAYKAKNRTLFWRRPYEQRGGRFVALDKVELFEGAYNFFGDQYDKLVHKKVLMGMDSGEACQNFSVSCVPEPWKDKKVLDYTKAMSLETRTADIPEHVEAMAVDISEYLRIPTAAEVVAIMNGADDDMGDDAQEHVPSEPVRTQAPAYTAPQATQAPAPAQQAPASASVDFGDVSHLVYGDPCPNGHKFGRDEGRRPACEGCKYRTECVAIAE